MWIFREETRRWEFVPIPLNHGMTAPIRGMIGTWYYNPEGWQAFLPEVVVWSPS